MIDTEQFKNGKQVEIWLDQFFRARGFIIEQTTAHQERVLYLGDRMFSKDDKTYYVEYKSGIQTFYTGNIFLETISVDTSNRPGWIYTCKADFIFYACLLNQKILVFRPDKLRAEIDILKSKFQEVKTGKGQNKGYNTYGVIVPLDYAEKHLTEQIIDLCLIL